MAFVTDIPSSTTITSRSSNIWVKFQVIGFHRYPSAPEYVGYLRERHRHVFHFKVAISVTHDEREIEFHHFKTWLQSQFAGDNCEFGPTSCETIARNLLNLIDANYPNRKFISVEVSEDDECGAVVAQDLVE